MRCAACSDITRWSGGSPRASQVRELYLTPLSVGGLGPVESLFGTTLTTLTVDYGLYREKTTSTLPSLWKFVGVTVPLKPSKRFSVSHIDVCLLVCIVQGRPIVFPTYFGKQGGQPHFAFFGSCIRHRGEETHSRSGNCRDERVASCNRCRVHQLLAIRWRDISVYHTCI